MAGEWFLSAVNLSRFEKMDPHMLVGLVNTDLRDFSDGLEDLVKTHGIDKEALVGKLAAAGYEYRPEQRQFR